MALRCSIPLRVPSKAGMRLRAFIMADFGAWRAHGGDGIGVCAAGGGTYVAEVVVMQWEQEKG